MDRSFPGGTKEPQARQHDLLPAMFEQIRDQAVILLDAEGRIVDWLMGAEAIFGYRREEALHRGVDMLFTPEDQERRIPHDEQTIAGREGRAEDDRWMQRKDGGRFWANGFISVLRTPEGAVAGYAKILRDRTDLRSQIEALRNRADANASEARRRTLLLGELAHELRNPLGVLVNAAQAIEMQATSDPDLQEASRLVSRQARYLGNIIDNLLEAARTRAGKSVLRLSCIALEDLLREVIETTRPRAEPKQQRIELLLPAVPVALEGDEVRLKQAFLNLLANAVKFSGIGTTIWVRALVEADEVIVHVRDEGRGIPPEWLPRVFELFTQAEPGTEADDAGGLGLGLAVVKECVELHGGVVQVRSEGIGRGAEFTVRLPLKLQESRSGGKRREAGAKGEKGTQSGA